MDREWKMGNGGENEVRRIETKKKKDGKKTKWRNMIEEKREEKETKKEKKRMLWEKEIT